MAQSSVKIPADPRNPSRSDILDAFDRAYDGDARVVTFFLEGGEKILAQIVDVGYESGKAGMYNIQGNMIGGGHVEGFYNANERHGVLRRT